MPLLQPLPKQYFAPKRVAISNAYCISKRTNHLLIRKRSLFNTDVNGWELEIWANGCHLWASHEKKFRTSEKFDPNLIIFERVHKNRFKLDVNRTSLAGTREVLLSSNLPVRRMAKDYDSHPWAPTINNLENNLFNSFLISFEDIN